MNHPDEDLLTTYAIDDYLKRAAAMRSVTPGIIDYVRKYLRRVAAEPDFAFVAPAPL